MSGSLLDNEEQQVVGTDPGLHQDLQSEHVRIHGDSVGVFHRDLLEWVHREGASYPPKESRVQVYLPHQAVLHFEHMCDFAVDVRVKLLHRLYDAV